MSESYPYGDDGIRAIAGLLDLTRPCNPEDPDDPTTVGDMLEEIDRALSTGDRECARLASENYDLRQELTPLRGQVKRYHDALTHIGEAALLGCPNPMAIAAEALSAEGGLPNGYPPALDEHEIKYVEDHLRSGVSLSAETGMRVLATAIKERRLRKMADDRANAAAQREALVRAGRE